MYSFSSSLHLRPQIQVHIYVFRYASEAICLGIAAAFNDKPTTAMTANTTPPTKTIALGDYLALLAREAGDTAAATSKYEERLRMIVMRDGEPVEVSVEAILQHKNVIVGIFTVDESDFNRLGIYDPETHTINLQEALLRSNPPATDVFVLPEENIKAYRPGSRGFGDEAVNNGGWTVAGPIFSGGSKIEVAKLQRYIESPEYPVPQLTTYTHFSNRAAGWVIDKVQP